MNDQQPTEFEQLLEELAQGSETAAQQIVDRYSASIRRKVSEQLPRAIRSKVNPSDIVQSVWLSVLVKRNQLAQLDTAQQLVGYLAGVAKKKVLEKYRRYTRMQAYDVKRERRMAGPSEKDKPQAMLTNSALTDDRHPRASEVAQQNETWQKLLSHCAPRDRRIVELRLQGVTQEEIAKQLDLSSRTVRRTLHKLSQAVEHD